MRRRLTLPASAIVVQHQVEELMPRADELTSLSEAFAEIDRLAEQLQRTGASPETVTLPVVDDATGAVVRRPGVQ